MSRKTLIILALVLVPVALMVLFGWIAGQFPNAHFVIAYALGGFATVLLSVGLFALTFYSSRSGHDEQIGYEQDSDEA